MNNCRVTRAGTRKRSLWQNSATSDSTLRSFIEAMGGELEIIARFPDRAPVKINQFEELA